MSSSEGSVTRWIAELEVGDDVAQIDEAQEELWRRYFHRLVGLANVKLGETPRAAADAEDVAIVALNSFFCGVAQGQYPLLRNRDDLWPLLVKITANKALDQQRYLLAAKRGGGRVRGDSALMGPADSAARWPAALLDEELRPDFLVAVSDQCQRLMGLLPDEQLQTIARRRLEGYSNAEIATELDVMERTIERRLSLIRSLWSSESTGDKSS